MNIGRDAAGGETREGAARGRRWLGFGMAVVALLIWAGWFAVTRFSLTRELGVYDVAALRLGVGTLVLLPAFLRGARGIGAAEWREGVVLSACWGAPFVLLLSWGIQRSSAAHAASITPTMMPVFAGLIGWAAWGERPGRRQWAGFAVIMAGVAVLSASLHTQGRPVDAWIGAATLLGASALWSVYTLRVRRTALAPLQAATMVCLYSAAAFLPVYVLSGVSRLGQAPWTEVAMQAVYQGVLVSGVSIMAYNRAIALIGAGAAAAVTSLVPVAAALLAVPLLGEVPTPPAAAATLCIAGGALLAARRPRPL